MRAASPGGLAVVTGAAGGLGSSFAHHLAQLGYRLLLVDRRQNQLEQISRTITTLHGTQIEPCVADLCQRAEVEALAQRLAQRTDLELLVNNAGFGSIDYFVDAAAGDLVQMIDLHVFAPTLLARAALPGMLARNRGGIINVASLSAWLPSAGNVSYGATKCYLAVLTTALHQELRGTNVRVQALCPGLIRTEFHAADRMQEFQRRYAPPAHLWMSPDEVVTCSLRKLAHGPVIVIPGLGYGIVGRLARMPLLQPLMQWATRGPRHALPQAAPHAPGPAPV